MTFTSVKYLEKSSSPDRNFPFTVRNELRINQCFHCPWLSLHITCTALLQAGGNLTVLSCTHLWSQLNLQNPAFGKNAREKEQSVGEITNELRIMKESLRHPNIVRYHRTFEESKFSFFEYFLGMFWNGVTSVNVFCRYCSLTLQVVKLRGLWVLGSTEAVQVWA